jgi:hypothetical protein
MLIPAQAATMPAHQEHIKQSPKQYPRQHSADPLLFTLHYGWQFLSGAGAGSASPPSEAPPSPEAIAAAEQQVVQQADAVRELKGLGLGNSHPEVQAQVQVRTLGCPCVHEP